MKVYKFKGLKIPYYSYNHDTYIERVNISLSLDDTSYLIGEYEAALGYTDGGKLHLSNQFLLRYRRVCIEVELARKYKI